MRKLETNDWIILNSIIYKIYTTENFTEMRQELLNQLKMVLDFDSADFYLASTEKGKLLCNPVTLNCDVDFSETYENIDYSRGILGSGKMLVYRETDIISDELGSGKMLVYRETDIISDESRVQTDYYQKVYKPNNWHYALQVVLARHKKFLGAISLYRTIGKEDFQYDDILLDLQVYLKYDIHNMKGSNILLI